MCELHVKAPPFKVALFRHTPFFFSWSLCKIFVRFVLTAILANFSRLLRPVTTDAQNHRIAGLSTNPLHIWKQVHFLHYSSISVSADLLFYFLFMHWFERSVVISTDCPSFLMVNYVLFCRHCSPTITEEQENCKQTRRERL